MSGDRRHSADGTLLPSQPSSLEGFVPWMHPLGMLLLRTKFVQRLLSIGVSAPDRQGTEIQASGPASALKSTPANFSAP